jgi:sulfur dioxygenase
MLFRQLFDGDTSTFTYVLADEATRAAVVIDPVREGVDRILAVLAEDGLRLAWSLETHVHADHVTGAGRLRERTSAKLGIHRAANDCGCADLVLAEGAELRVGEVRLRVLETPGHTPDSVSYLLGDGAVSAVFTGDALLVGTCGRTDFQGGDPGQLYDSVTRKLFTLPDATVVWPAHDYQGQTHTTIGAERRGNSRLAGRTRAQFVELMEGLHLPYPRAIDHAVPANRHCGLEREHHAA